MDYANTVSVITGATEGIGHAIASALGRQGSALAICGRSEAKLATAARALRDLGIERVLAVRCDVSAVDQVAAFRDRIFAEFGRADVLVNNAGLAHFGALEELTVGEIDETLAVNVRGVFLTTKAFLADMVSRGSGDIVNIASVAGKNGFSGGTAYAASKHAVMGFSRSLMLEVRDRGIRVIAVCPGSVDTAFFDKAGTRPGNLDRVLRPEDVADTVMCALALPRRASLSEVEVRPTDP